MVFFIIQTDNALVRLYSCRDLFWSADLGPSSGSIVVGHVGGRDHFVREHRDTVWVHAPAVQMKLPSGSRTQNAQTSPKGA